MPRKYSLTGEEIKDLRGVRVHGGLFSLLVAPSPMTHAKCACVVSKKVSTKAVERNTIKRRCRAILAKRVMKLEVPRALVFHAKRESANATFAEITRDIESLLARVSARS
jgi:ribonuclease P protein component